MITPILEEEAGVESSPPGTNRNLEVNSSYQHRDTSIKNSNDNQSNDVDDRTVSEGLKLEVSTDHNIVATGKQNFNLGDVFGRHDD